MVIPARRGAIDVLVTNRGAIHMFVARGNSLLRPRLGRTAPVVVTAHANLHHSARGRGAMHQFQPHVGAMSEHIHRHRRMKLPIALEIAPGHFDVPYVACIDGMKPAMPEPHAAVGMKAISPTATRRPPPRATPKSKPQWPVKKS